MNKFKIDLQETERGFLRGEFVDSYGEECSIQESSNIEPHLWLGVNQGGKQHLGHDLGCRMHLTPEMAAALWPLIKRFSERGDLRESVDRIDDPNIANGIINAVIQQQTEGQK